MSQIRVKFTAPDLAVYGGESLEDYIAALTAVLEQAPPELRGGVTIEFSAYDDYGSPTPTCDIELLRDATPEEEAAQKTEEERRARNQLAFAERSAREAQARLAKLADQ